MGVCESKNESKQFYKQNTNYLNQLNIESYNKQRESCSIGHGKPINKEEIDELSRFQFSMCKIIYETIENGKIEKQSGTGFFCQINDKNISFKKGLFTNNHILNKSRIEINKEVEFEYLNIMKKIKMTKNRKVFTNENLDYTCIEIFNSDKIFDKDKIKNIFRIDTEIFENKNNLINKEIFILQYPNGDKLSQAHGKILDIKDNIIKHSAATLIGSSGSPLIKRYNVNLVIGIHYGGDNKKYLRNNEFMYNNNYATPFDIIIKDIEYKLSTDKINIIKNNNIIEYRNIINIIYYKKNNNNYNSNNIFGGKFVENNKNNIKLIINGNQSKLINKYNLKEGKNKIQIIIIKQLTNLENMFICCISLKNIEELKYLNTNEITNFSGMFGGCSSLSDIKALQNWNVSNGNDFSAMFRGCISLSNIKSLQSWNVSNGYNFSDMFSDCKSLSDIKALQNWNVSNGNYFSGMFFGCSSLSDIKALQNWNVSNGNYFYDMFRGCSSLSKIKSLQNWNVSNGNDFSAMFMGCSSLSDIKALKNWNVSNGNDFTGMFYGCSSLTNITVLQQNWNVSNEKYFSDMFCGEILKNSKIREIFLKF